MDKELENLYQQSKTNLNLSKKNPNKAIEEFKNIQKQIKFLKAASESEINPQSNKRIVDLEIIILNNLACAYNQKGKYKASLYNLEKVRQLQQRIFYSHKKKKKSQDNSIEKDLKQWKNSPEILHQIATTNSNFCAVYSQMGDHQTAIRQIQQAIKYLQSNEITKKSDALTIFYYNYAIELEHLGLVNDAHKRASKGYSISSIKPQMKQKFEELIAKLEQKMRKREKKIGEYLASKYKSPFFESKELKMSKNGLSTNYISNKLANSRQIDHNLSAYSTKLPRSLKKIQNKSLYPRVHLPRKYQKSNDDMFKSNTMIVESRRKVRSLYEQKNEIPLKNKLSLIRKKETLAKLLEVSQH